MSNVLNIIGYVLITFYKFDGYDLNNSQEQIWLCFQHITANEELKVRFIN